MLGGTFEAYKKLKQIGDFKKYDEERNDLTKETTQLSPYLKFGCVSIREVYEIFRDKLQPEGGLVRQLIWRDFYIHLLDAYPKMLQGKSLNEKYDSIKWGNNREWFKKWCDGETGYPIVDACMKQLNESGYMHNRGRLIVSSFLIKVLQIDWRWGEKYFAQKLIDYDPAANNGNWQWASGSGADSQPYFRIFNPWLQSSKHDPNAIYIKKWLPNLSSVQPKHLHEWDKYFTEYNLKDLKYFSPIVNYKTMKERTLKMYKDALYF
jgi:deoxyribodipyrimidine photo-lyase